MWKRDLFTRIKPIIPRIHPSFVWTHLSPEVFRKEKGLQDKTTTPTTDTTSKQVDSGDQTPVDEDADVILMNELGILGGEEQSSSKATDQASSSIEATKETSDQATSPIEVVSATPVNPENLDDLIQRNSLAIKSNALYVRMLRRNYHRFPERYCLFILNQIPVEQASSTTQKKRPNEGETTEKSSSKKKKVSTNEGESPCLSKNYQHQVLH
ncbi:hypothetical protein RhiirC2_855597 [Rhizophagus irregularis]|uniref:Uncharacterized protein n=1 Tax=Rhizophagus irregularis TaxID=588596 RepID=A0A2N1MLQ4_9GLOM|nr:hypothetical protein RhiirC2_855597 [Rhizophagus irregularis]